MNEILHYYRYRLLVNYNAFQYMYYINFTKPRKRFKASGIVISIQVINMICDKPFRF